VCAALPKKNPSHDHLPFWPLRFQITSRSCIKAHDLHAKSLLLLFLAPAERMHEQSVSPPSRVESGVPCKCQTFIQYSELGIHMLGLRAAWAHSIVKRAERMDGDSFGGQGLLCQFEGSCSAVLCSMGA
jgi:hypothetical protein